LRLEVFVKKNWVGRFGRVAASALALTMLAPATGAAQTPNKLQDVDDTAATEKALFALFPDLDSAKTRERLASLRKDPKRSKLLSKVSTALATPSTKAVDIEADVLALVAGEKPDSAELTLNAVMRDYYDHYVVGHTGNKALTAVSVGLEQTDNLLTSAAFGSNPQSRRIRKARLIRR
jgi:hypothetical protein